MIFLRFVLVFNTSSLCGISQTLTQKYSESKSQMRTSISVSNSENFRRKLQVLSFQTNDVISSTMSTKELMSCTKLMIDGYQKINKVIAKVSGKTIDFNSKSVHDEIDLVISSGHNSIYDYIRSLDHYSRKNKTNKTYPTPVMKLMDFAIDNNDEKSVAYLLNETHNISKILSFDFFSQLVHIFKKIRDNKLSYREIKESQTILKHLQRYTNRYNYINR